MLDSEVRTFATTRRLLLAGWVLSRADNIFFLTNPEDETQTIPVRESESDAVLKLLVEDSRETVGARTLIKYKLREDIVKAEEANSALDGPKLDAANEDG